MSDSLRSPTATEIAVEMLTYKPKTGSDRCDQRLARAYLKLCRRLLSECYSSEEDWLIELIQEVDTRE